MNHHQYSGRFSQRNMSRNQLVLTALEKSATEMFHIDEFLLWLSYAIVQQFGVPAVHFWAGQADATGQFVTQLRAAAYEDDSLPQHVTLNGHVAAFADKMRRHQSTHTLEMIDNLFPSHQAALFHRYGLYYCASYYVSSSAILPPKADSLSDEILLIPLSATLVLFLRQPLLPELRMSIERILRQAMPVAETHGLLLSASEISSQLFTKRDDYRQKQALLALSKLIPCHTEDADLMKSSNPLAGTLVIADKQARRLNAAIDGYKNFGELCAITHLDKKEGAVALQLLLAQRRIQLFEPDGQQVNSSSFFEDFNLRS